MLNGGQFGPNLRGRQGGAAVQVDDVVFVLLLADAFALVATRFGTNPVRQLSQ